MASRYVGPVYSTTIIESVPICRFSRPKRTSQSGQKIRKLTVRHLLASFRSRCSRTHLEAGRVGVVPVHLNPHPRRTHHSQGNSFPVQLRYSTPTFEKSNVLVLYVLHFPLSGLNMTLLLTEGRLVQVKTCIELVCIFKLPHRREDAISENSCQSPRCAIFSERCDVLHAGGSAVFGVMPTHNETTLQGRM
jgi:hypothetical protein